MKQGVGATTHRTRAATWPRNEKDSSSGGTYLRRNHASALLVPVFFIAAVDVWLVVESFELAVRPASQRSFPIPD